jgi:hypothetical protein
MDEYGNGVGDYLEVIFTYFSFVETLAVGFMFWVSTKGSGSMMLNLANILCAPSESENNKSSSWPIRAYDFIKGWLFSTLVLIIVGLVMMVFLFYGVIATWLLTVICEFVGLKDSINFAGTTVAMTVAFILGNMARLVKTLSKQIKWLRCGVEFPENYEKRSERFKNLDSYLLDYEKDDIGRWPRE